MVKVINREKWNEDLRVCEEIGQLLEQRAESMGHRKGDLAELVQKDFDLIYMSAIAVIGRYFNGDFAKYLTSKGIKFLWH